MAYSHRGNETGPLQPAPVYRDQDLVNTHSFFQLARGLGEAAEGFDQSELREDGRSLMQWDCERIQLIANVEVVRMTRKTGCGKAGCVGCGGGRGTS